MGSRRSLPLLACLLLMGLCIHSADNAKVILMPFNHRSNVMYFAKLGSALVEDGHDVWLLTMTKFEALLKNSGIMTITFTVSKEADFSNYIERFMEENPGNSMTYEIIDQIMPAHERYCREVMTNENILDAIKQQQFDLAVFEGSIEHAYMFMIPYKFDIPFITVQGFSFSAWMAGVTGMPSIEPEPETLFSNRMDFWQRLHNMNIWISTYSNNNHLKLSYLEEYVSDKPKITFSELLRKSEMYLLNFEIICLDYPRVSAPNYQFLGASTASSPKPLPAELDNFVNGAEQGLVVMSLGTHMAVHFNWRVIGDKVFKALGRLNLRAIVQYDLDERAGQVPDNVLLMKWLPQNDLLGHPKTRLFITHGGNNGQNEAVYHGVPSLVMPMLCDQPYSGERVERHGYGKHVKDKLMVSSDELYEMMTEIIYNKTYSENIKKCSAIVRSMPPASERFVFWVNHILQFGGAHLRPPSLDMPLYQVLMLDIVAFFVVSSLIIVYILLFIIWCLYHRLLKGVKERKPEGQSFKREDQKSKPEIPKEKPE